VFRSAKEVTPLDVKELYDVSANSDQAVKLLDSTRTSNLQILELNPSYGAQGLFLFQSFEISEQMDAALRIEQVFARIRVRRAMMHLKSGAARNASPVFL
jgi:glycosylphosphatidylinositol transamidase (GPIT) subunit GPI8